MASMKLQGVFKWKMDFDITSSQFEGFSISVPEQLLKAEFSYYNQQDEEQMIVVDIPIRKASAEIDVDSMTGRFNAISMNLAPKSILWSPDSSAVNFESNYR